MTDWAWSIIGAGVVECTVGDNTRKELEEIIIVIIEVEEIMVITEASACPTRITFTLEPKTAVFRFHALPLPTNILFTRVPADKRGKEWKGEVVGGSGREPKQNKNKCSCKKRSR